MCARKVAGWWLVGKQSLLGFGLLAMWFNTSAHLFITTYKHSANLSSE
jgi:hypothetical protein